MEYGKPSFVSNPSTSNTSKVVDNDLISFYSNSKAKHHILSKECGDTKEEE